MPEADNIETMDLAAPQAVPSRGAAEVFLRDSSLAGVDVKQRLIDLVAVPWDEEAEVAWRGTVWREVFRRGAFDGIENHAGRIAVNREHVIGDTIGKVVKLDPYSDQGLLARVKVAQTLRGDETLALADEDMISASVSYFIKRPSDVQAMPRNRRREVRRAFLEHLAMVEAPAFKGARVLAVRAEQSGLAVVANESPLATPVLDEMMSDDVLAWARSRAIQ